MTTKTPKINTPGDYHRSNPQIPEGLEPLEAWAARKGLTTVCVKKWGWAGKLLTYRVPGYGLRSFVKTTDADKVLRPQQSVPDLAR